MKIVPEKDMDKIINLVFLELVLVLVLMDWAHNIPLTLESAIAVVVIYFWTMRKKKG